MFLHEFTLSRLERVLHGAGSVASLGDELDRLSRQRAVVVTGRTLGGSPVLTRVTGALGPRCADVFTRARQHVPESAVNELVSVIERTGADCVVSFGGGSPIDLAKLALNAVLARAASPGTERDPAIVHVSVPTTLSASEYTSVAGVTDEATRIKRGVSDPRTTARAVICDPELAMSTPDWLWAATGMRARLTRSHSGAASALAAKTASACPAQSWRTRSRSHAGQACSGAAAGRPSRCARRRIALTIPAWCERFSSREQRFVLFTGRPFIPTHHRRQQHRNRRTVRGAIVRGQRIRAGVCRAKHRVLDRHSGIERAQLHRAARFKIVGLTQDALIVWFEQSPGFAREDLRNRISLRRDVGFNCVRDGVETRGCCDAARLRYR
jgi:hypothetical protein